MQYYLHFIGKELKFAHFIKLPKVMQLVVRIQIQVNITVKYMFSVILLYYFAF